MTVMNRLASAAAAALFALTRLPASVSAQDLLDLSLRPGEVGYRTTGAYRAPNGHPERNDMSHQVWLRLPVAGHLLDRRLLTFTGTLRPSYRQHASSAFDDPVSGDALSLDTSLQLFRARPLSLTATAYRNSGVTEDSFGARNVYRSETMTAILAYRNPYIPLRLSRSHRDRKNHWDRGAGSRAVRQDEVVDRLRLSGRNGKMNFHLTRTDLHDRAWNRDFSSVEGNATHTLRWGKGSHLRSALAYLKRDGFMARRSRSLSEQAHLQHTRGVSSTIRFATRTSMHGDVASANRTYGLVTRATLATGIDASLAATGQNFRSGSAISAERYRLSPRLSSRFGLPGGLNFTGRLSLSYERGARTRARNGHVEVLDERHTIGAGRSFYLEQPQVDAGSVIVQNDDRTVTYVEDVDYLLDRGEGLTQIRIPLGSRIEEDQVVLVSYRYLSRSTGSFRSLFTEYDLGLSWMGVTVRHGRFARDSHPLEAGGDVVASADDSERWLSAAYGGHTPVGSVDLYAERRVRSAGGLDYLSDQLRGTLGMDLPRRTELRLAGIVGHRRSGGRTGRTSSARATLRWTARSDLNLEGGVQAWTWAENGESDDRFVGGHGSVHWRVGRIVTSLRVDHTQRGLLFDEEETRWSMNLTRRF